MGVSFLLKQLSLACAKQVSNRKITFYIVRGHWLAVCFVIKWHRHHYNEAVYQSLLPGCLHSMRLYEWTFLKFSLSPWLLCMHNTKPIILKVHGFLLFLSFLRALLLLLMLHWTIQIGTKFPSFEQSVKISLFIHKMCSNM